jgi:hypothetical protein
LPNAALPAAGLQARPRLSVEVKTMLRRAQPSLRAALVCAALALAATGPASAHSSRRSAADDSGIAINALTHGQMAVISDYRSQILALAARQPNTDRTFRRLRNYGAIQFTYCLWGLVPGSVRDEHSPFNECSHAYLSAAHALLLYMQDMPTGDLALRAELEALLSRIDAEMVRRGASLVLCQFSGGEYNTASLIRPDWRQIPSHLPSLLSFGVLGLGLAAGTIGLNSSRRRQASA